MAFAVLLRTAKRMPDGSRRWIVPGKPNAVTLRPSTASLWAAPSLSWPHGETQRSVRLDWHRSIAKAGARELIATYEAPL